LQRANYEDTILQQHLETGHKTPFVAMWIRKML